MWIKMIIVMSFVLGTLEPQGVTTKARMTTEGYPIFPKASLLIGLPPEFLMITNERESIRLQPEQHQPEIRDVSVIFPSISRDGEIIAYGRIKSGDSGRTMVVSTYSVSTGKRTDHFEAKFVGSVAISPDGSMLAFSTYSQKEERQTENRLHIISMKTGQQMLGPDTSDSSVPVFVSWSPDSHRIAYALSGAIRIWNLETTKDIKVASGDLPVWSPSGDWIAFLPGVWNANLGRYVFTSGRWGAHCLVVHPDGTGEKTLINLSHSDNHSPNMQRIFTAPPVWSPDSKSILLNELDDIEANTVTVYLLNIETRNWVKVYRKSLRVFGWAEAG